MLLNKIQLFLLCLFVITFIILIEIIYPEMITKYVQTDSFNYNNNNNLNNNNQPINQIDNNENLTCEPIKSNVKQFKVLLDGITYPNRVPLYHNKSIDLKCLNSSNKIKTILMWTKFKGLPLINYGFGIRKPFENLNCPVTNCELTDDRQKFSHSDLVLFHLRNKIDYIPERAFQNQKYVHVIYESPIHCHLCDKYENVFNYSATYRINSDFTSIYWTDSGLYWNINPSFNETYNYLLNKINFSAALISNCDKKTMRMSYIDELKKYIPVNIYGKCGNECPTSNCRKYISDNYKFFFLFENSLCNEYMTEKIFDSLKFNTIPVVMGIGNYSYYIPKSGYINVFDFHTPHELARYLIYLSENETAYNNYFKWKRFLCQDEKIVLGGYLCEMCIKLHLEDRLGIVEKKQLNNLSKMYGLFENCYKEKVENVLKFSVENLTEKIYSYYMSPEKR